MDILPSPEPPTLTRVSWCSLEHDTLTKLLSANRHSVANVWPILRSWYRTGGRLDDWTTGRVGPRVAGFLAQQVSGIKSTIARRHTSSDGTIKLLIDFANPDDLKPETRVAQSAECVLMPAYRAGRAMACVSSQIGCAMGCAFCASTKSGLARNLTSGEIVEQFVHLQREARGQQRRITSLVFMGMGEPMHNLDEVIAAIRRIADPDMGGVGWRQVTVSTVGIVPGMDALADANLNVHLALSLHAADDETRSRIVPMNRRYDVGAVIDAARRFYDRTGRIVTIEWCLIDGVNDGDEQATMLASLLIRHDLLRRARVNVIPFNPIDPGTPRNAPGSAGILLTRPSPAKVKQFIERLQLLGVVCHARDTRGDDVAAACGQLRRLHLKQVVA